MTDEKDYPSEWQEPASSKISKFLLATVGAASILALGAWGVQLMWNFAVVAAISVAEPINFWHGLCLMILITVRFNVNASD